MRKHMIVLTAGLAALASACATASAPTAPQGRIELSTCRPAGFTEDVRCGVFNVPENRAAPNGRMLPLAVVVLPARQQTDKGPIFFLSGGPGQAATESAQFMVASRMREHHDIVFVDLRGTGEGHRLDCEASGSDENLQTYLDPPIFSNVEAYVACRDQLAANADLTQYTTEISMRDIDEARQALGYDRINLSGGSYGTRAALVYIRNHGAHVRSAFLTGLAPFENRNPLYHAPAAQRAFERVADQCAADAACHRAFPDVRADLNAVVTRLRTSPARVTVHHPVTNAPTEVSFSAQNFADGLRVMLYSSETSRAVPFMLHRARQGDLSPFAENAVRSSRGLATGLARGLLLSVTCAEEAPRIRLEEIPGVTGNSFITDARVRNQVGVCAVWPRGVVSADHAAPFTSEVSAVLVSGDLDPVTPPEWGEIAQRYLPNSIHIVNPEGHAAGGECVDNIEAAFFEFGSVEGLDTSCVAAMRLPPFVLNAADLERLAAGD
jgi:pimeloyl-ACP methyl ester carboxylesterase